MKKYIILLFAAIFFTTIVQAQSSMSDDQVMKFVQKEHKAGSSQSQIVTKLMQNGVNIEQIRRVRKKYERLSKEEGLGAVDDSREKTGDRSRKNNGKDKLSSKDKDKYSQYRIKDTPNSNDVYYNENDEDFMLLQEEMDDWMPVDTIKLYEKLLKETKKNKKKVFGRDIFNNKDLTFEPNMNIATPQNYRLGPGDAVYIDIYGASQKTLESTVSPDGTITIEGFGPVSVSGLTVEQANNALRSKLGARYSSSQIKLTVGQTKTIMVNVMGEVKAPGTYTLSAFASVFHALYMAGGTNELGTMRNIKVYRNNKLVSVVDIYDYILNGKLTGNVRLADNDVIVVGAYECLVNIQGKVKRPMYYEMKKSESLASILKYSGGFTGDAYNKSVRLVRKTGRQYSVFNVEEFDFSSFFLSDGDSISVDSIIPRFENTVQIKGSVFRPGMYQLGGSINTVKSLIEQAEGIKEDAFSVHAVMHRMRADRTLEVLQVDVDGIMSGRVPDIPLKQNDVLFIPTKQEMMQEQTITIRGEVFYPGVYKYAANQTLEDFVLQAGGLKETASTSKVDVARRISNPNALVGDSLISKTYTFALKDGFVIEGEPGFVLQPFDEVFIRKSPGYSKQQTVIVDGEVMFAGSYSLAKKNTRLSDVIKAAGGANELAYIRGARLERKINDMERLRMLQVLEKEKKQRNNNLMEMAMKSGNISTIVDINKENTQKEYSGNNKKLTKAELEQLGDTYWVAIELDKAIENPGGIDDIVLREGDRIVVPQYDGTVKVNGEVLYPNTVAYKKGKNVNYYIDQAGGFSNKAKKNQAYIIYMNGGVAKVSHNAKPLPGCEIVVPEKAVSKTSLAETLSIGSSVAAIATMIATIANIL